MVVWCVARQARGALVGCASRAVLRIGTVRSSGSVLAENFKLQLSRYTFRVETRRSSSTYLRGARTVFMLVMISVQRAEHSTD